MTHILLVIIYISFISLGLPDALLGAAWPVIHTQFNVPVSYAGIISATIAVCTVISSLFSERLTRFCGTGKITAVSVAITAAALFGFSRSGSFYMMVAWAIPYGLGAGSVDASLNNYVALHYTSRHMSWLHCMWGVGTCVGPYVMGAVLTGGYSWSTGYFVISLIQIVLTIGLFCTLKLWNTENTAAERAEKSSKSLALTDVLKISGAKKIMVVFFCYCAAEQTAMLWAGSYLAIHIGLTEEKAALFSGAIFMGITAGRFISGFITLKFDDIKMIRLGQVIFIIGCVVMMLPFGQISGLLGLMLTGLGCAPIYPCLLHMTPVNFGEDKSRAVMGVQMASAYVGSCAAPALFGVVANNISIALMPVYVGIIILIQIFTHEKLLKEKQEQFYS